MENNNIGLPPTPPNIVREATISYDGIAGVQLDENVRHRILSVLKKNNTQYLMALVNSHPDFFHLSLDNNHSWAIHIASEYGAFECVVFLINSFPSQLNQLDGFGQTPLICASSQGHDRIVQYLVDKGAFLGQQVCNLTSDRHGLTAMTCAMMSNHFQTARVLWNAGSLLQQKSIDLDALRIMLIWGAKANYVVVFNCALERVDFNVLPIPDQVKLMSIAVQHSSREVIELLVNKNNALLVMPNEKGLTPMLSVVYRGDVHLLLYLIEQKINVNQVVCVDGSVDNGKPLYIVAHERKHYAAASLMISQLLNTLNQDTLFDFISDGETVLDYILLSSINAKVIMKNKRLMDLINPQEAQITRESIQCYKTAASRRPSFFAEINCETGEPEVFHEQVLLGNGANSVARHFVNSQQTKHVVIKSPVYNWKQTNLDVSPDLELESAIKEIAFIKKSFDANDTTYSHAYLFKRVNYEGYDEFTNRSVIPYAGQRTVADTWRHISFLQCMAKFILIMTQSLIRLHEKGIIHGDIKENNAVVFVKNNQPIQVNFIDFEYSYFLSDNYAKCNPASTYWAPERRENNKFLKPDVSQDVYSYASMLERMIASRSKRNELINKYPSIYDFITNGLKQKACERPTLSSFKTNLSHEMGLMETPVPSILSEVEEDFMNRMDP